MIRPYYEHAGITIYHGDCREVMPTLDRRSIGCLFTDPPYGIRKAEWDEQFTLDWLPAAAEVCLNGLAIMPGVHNLLHLPFQVGRFQYRWMLSCQLSNGMTRGLMGFGNWIPCAVYAPEGDSLYKPLRDCASVPVGTEAMPDHPSPKPKRAITWLLQRLPGNSIIDPFMGSGTALVAARERGMQSIGIEIEERYCEIAAKRLSQEVLELA